MRDAGLPLLMQSREMTTPVKSLGLLFASSNLVLGERAMILYFLKGAALFSRKSTARRVSPLYHRLTGFGQVTNTLSFRSPEMGAIAPSPED